MDIKQLTETFGEPERAAGYPGWKPTLSIKARRALEAMKQAAQRHIAEMKLSRLHLLEIFGMAFKAKFQEAVTKSQLPGKHYAANHHGKSSWIAGTKLVRMFIRRSGRESQYWRELYKILTGGYYKGEEQPA